MRSIDRSKQTAHPQIAVGTSSPPIIIYYVAARSTKEASEREELQTLAAPVTVTPSSEPFPRPLCCALLLRLLVVCTVVWLFDEHARFARRLNPFDDPFHVRLCSIDLVLLWAVEASPIALQDALHLVVRRSIDDDVVFERPPSHSAFDLRRSKSAATIGRRQQLGSHVVDALTAAAMTGGGGPGHFRLLVVWCFATNDHNDERPSRVHQANQPTSTHRAFGWLPCWSSTRAQLTVVALLSWGWLAGWAPLSRGRRPHPPLAERPALH